jgi:hypothetical protein
LFSTNFTAGIECPAAIFIGHLTTLPYMGATPSPINPFYAIKTLHDVLSGMFPLTMTYALKVIIGGHTRII